MSFSPTQLAETFLFSALSKPNESLEVAKVRLKEAGLRGKEVLFAVYRRQLREVFLSMGKSGICLSCIAFELEQSPDTALLSVNSLADVHDEIAEILEGFRVDFADFMPREEMPLASQMPKSSQFSHGVFA